MKSSIRLPIIALLALSLLGAATHSASAGVQEDQEKIALGWIEAHNAANVDTMAAFRAKHFQRSELTDWQPAYERMVEQFGHLKVYGIMIDGSGKIMVGVHIEKTDEKVHLGFNFFEDDANQIEQIGVDGGGPGDEENGLPDLELTGDWKQRTPALDTYLRDLADHGAFSGAVLVANPEGVLFEGAYGLASREFNVANNLATRFDVGSCNKDYTRVAILQLAAKGKLSLDDTVGKFLPDYPNDVVKNRVTIQQLLDHRAGLGDYFTEEYRQTPMSHLRHVEDYIPIWGPKPLLSEPGERESYSNFGYTVLGAIIETVSGQRYPDYVTEYVFKPAGMNDTGFFDTDAVIPNVAVGYTMQSMDGPLEEPIKNIYLEPAKGGPWGKSYSTVRDLYRFYDGMMNGKILEGEDNWLKGTLQRGGIMLGGAGPGLNTMMSVEDGVMVVVLANMDPPIAEDVALKISREARR